MKTITGQTKYFGMMRKIVTIVLLHLTILVGEVITAIPAGNGDRYNISAANTTITDGAGGFTITLTGVTANALYYFYASPDNSSWTVVTGGTGLNNTEAGAFSSFRTTVGTSITVACNESRFATSWPGDEGTIYIIALNNLAVNVTDPAYSCTIDLSQPTAGTGDLSAIIYSNNKVTTDAGETPNIEYATTDDIITIEFYSDEDLSDDDFSGNISGAALTSVIGSGTHWYANSTVATQGDGVATYNITYKDINGNVGTSSISATTDGSTVTIDQTDPTVAVLISSNNATSSLAKINDIVTIDISSDEILYSAPLTAIDGNIVTPNPNAPSTTYTITRTMVEGDNEGVVGFYVNNIMDRAGNTITNITDATDGSSVTFDPVDPTLTGLTIASDNDLDPTLAMPGDVVTLTFYTSHEAQVPEVTVLTVPALVTNASNDKLTWSATHTMTALDPAGVVTFVIDYKDLAGNSGDQATGILSGSNITYDKEFEGIDNIVVESTNTDDETLAKSGEWISVEITADESLSSITGATIGGNAITGSGISEISPTQWKLSYQVQDGDGDGSVSYAFTAVDLAGNTEDVTAAGSAVTIDNTAPTLTLVGILSNSSTNTAYAKVGDDVTLTITSDEDLAAAPTVFLAGIAVTPDVNSATSYEAVLTMASGHTQTNAPMAISIEFSDVVGNSGTEVIATNNSSSVIFDKTVPTLSDVSISADNDDNPAYAKAGSIITLAFTAANTENLFADPTVKILHVDDTVTDPDDNLNVAAVSGSGASWEASYTAAVGNREGTVAFTIDFFDYAGNAGTQVDAIISGTDVIFDETPPTLDPVSISSSNTNAPAGTLSKSGDVITISITADNNIKTPTITIAQNAATIATGTDGESVYTATYEMKTSDANADAIAFTVDYSDLAGNEGTQVVALVNDATGVSFDKSPPSFDVVKIESLENDVSESTDDDDHTKAKSGNTITVSLESDEDLQTGLNPTVTIAGNTAVVERGDGVDDTFSATYEMSDSDIAYDDLAIPINISTYEDPAGNEGATVTATIGGSEVIFDMTAPSLGTATIASDNTFSHWATTDDIITLTIVSDEDLQTMAAEDFTLLGSTADVTVTAGVDAKHWTADKTVSDGHTQGVVDFIIRYEDVVGNSGDAITSVLTGKNVTVDYNAPSITKADIASNNTGGGVARPELAAPGNTITLTVVTDENIQEPTISIATHELDPDDVVIGANAKNWTATYQMTESDGDGVVAFAISFSDSAGNAGNTGNPITAITNDDDGNNVTFSKTKPGLTDVEFVSDNTPHPNYANTESELTLTFDSVEELIANTVEVTINGREITSRKTLIHDGEKESWEAVYDLGNAYADLVRDNINGVGVSDGAGYTVPFTIDYDATNGNSGETVTQEDIDVDDRVTFDETPPVAATLTIASDNDNVASMCKVSDSVTVTFETGEILQQPTILIAGKSADVAVGGTEASWTGKYKMLESDSEGIVSLSVTFMDYASNSGEPALAKLSGDNVTFDQTVPTLSGVSISSDNEYNSDWATTGDEVRLVITADDDPLHSSPIFTIASDAAVVPTTNDGGTTWTGTYIMQDDDTQQEIAISIAFEDLAGNPGVAVDATMDETSVTFDKTATVMTGVEVDLDSDSDTGVDSEDNLTKDRELTFTVTGLAETDSIYLVIDATTSTTVKGKAVSPTLSLTSDELDNNEFGYSVSVKSRDLAGNLSLESPALKVRVDIDLPVITSVPNLLEADDLGFDNEDDITNVVQPQLILSDLPSTVLDSIRLFYNIGAGDELCGAYRMSQVTLDTVQVSSVLSDNDYSFTYTLIDSAGNISVESSGLTVTVDATSPSQPATPDLTSGTDSGVSNSDDITKSSDIGFSVGSLTIGDRLYLKANDVSLDDDVYDSNDIANTTQVITISDAVSAEYTAFSMDIAGNQSIASGGLDVVVDETAPDVSAVEIDLDSDSDLGTKDDDNLTNDYTPEFSVSSLTVTDSVYLYVNGADVPNQRLKATSTTMSITTDSLDEGSNVISIFASDLAGNLSIVSDKTLTIRVDTQPPTMSASAPDLLVEDDEGFDNTDNITNNSSPRFELVELPIVQDSIRLFYNTGTGDVLSKADSMSQGITDTIQVGTPLGADTYLFTYVIIDSAGNFSSTSPVCSVVVDMSPPAVPNAADLVEDPDIGKSSTDDLTNVATPEFTVTGILSGNEAKLYYIDGGNDTTHINTQFVSSESVSFTSSVLTTGSYTFFPVASDTAGNEREGADLVVTIDLDIPSTIISFDGDSLVKFADAQSVATFTFSEEMDDATNPPTVDVDYPGGGTDLSAQTLTNVNATTWNYAIPLNTSGLDSINGVIALTLNASDLAGNIVPVNSITGLSALRVDNTTPVFSSFSPDTGAFINALNIFGWTLSETIESGSVAFEKKSGPGIDTTLILDATELVAGERLHSAFANYGESFLEDSTIYDIIFTSIDTAGNIGLDTIANVSYDTTAPKITLTFDQLAGSDNYTYSTADSVVLVTATWDERAEPTEPTPTISVDFGGTEQDISDAAMIMNEGDSTIWTYEITIPSGDFNNGNVLFTITGTDLAGNANQDPLVMNDTLVVDNTKPTVTFSYSNVSQPTLDGWKRGKAGDIIDITATFSKETHLINDPLINIAYATDSDENIAPTTSSNDDSVWIFRTTLLANENNTGYITVTTGATDRAGNQIGTYADTSYNDIFYIDNTLPTFSTTKPDSGTYVNHTLVNYRFNEAIQSGSITWTRLSGNIDNNSPHVIALEDSIEELGPPNRYEDYSLINGPDDLVSETYYQVKFSAIDSSNNQSIEFIETPVYYDTTGSSVTVTFSQLFVSADSSVTITATFNERVLPTPTISLDFGGAFNDITDSSMTIVDNDSSIWTLTIDSIPSGIENQGNVGIAITAEDLATNTLDTTIITDTLYVDNTNATATFSYINITQDSSLANVGIGGDVIEIKVQMNEPIVVYDPIPALNYYYAGGSGDSVNGVIAQSYSNGDSVWVFQITLQDSAYNDGPLDITLVAKDKSNNYVTEFENGTLFQVDNEHPADFVTGDPEVFGNNAVQEWINGATDSVGVVIPIETNQEDPTLLYGGYVNIEFYNLTRGAGWVTVGAQDSIEQAGDDEIFYRTIMELATGGCDSVGTTQAECESAGGIWIEAAMPHGSGLILGDSLEIRASITDRNGNLTYGTESTLKLVYDPFAPNAGQIIGGNMFTDTPEDTNKLYSQDMLTIQWSEFIDQGEDASGTDKYQLAFEKFESEGTEANNFYDWHDVALPTGPVEYPLGLEHNEKYIGHIRAMDVAGNISDTLVTDTLFRFNTGPIIEGLSDTVVQWDEDIFWTETLSLSDPDLDLLQGDSFTYKAITTRIVGDPELPSADSVIIDTAGVLTWTPTQDDTGTYEIEIIATDAYGLNGTFILPMVVIAVNDTPVVDIKSPDNNLSWEEDTTTSVSVGGQYTYIKRITLTDYVRDVDNDSTEMTWQAIIIDPAQFDEDFPLGRVVVGPGTPWSVHARLLREYLGFDFNPKGMKSPVISRSMANQINTRNNNSDSLIVEIDTVSSDTVVAYFNSALNYNGSHGVIFIATDPGGLEDKDTIMVTVKAENDAPVISEIPLMEVTENDSIYMKFGTFTTDVDDDSLTFIISATTNEDKISISESTYTNSDSSYKVWFSPEKLWSQEATIQVIATDDEDSDTATFTLDVLRVPRPEIKVAVVQNNAFSNYLQVIVSDTVEMTKIITLEVQNEDIDLDTIADYTWAGEFNFSTTGNYSIDVLAIADVGDTVVTELIALAAAREASRWFGRSVDGRFSVAGDPGSVSYDQSFIIVDSSLFADDFNDRASYVLGDEFFEFGKAIEVRFGSQRNDLAIYRRKNGVTWEELPSLSKDGEIFTLSEKTGYFKLGPKTIIVPEETNIHQNYPNPFNPITTIMYDIGLMDGLRQNVSITIYNLLGQHVKTLIHNKDQVGQFTVQWNGQNEFGQPMSTGVYFVQLMTKTGIVKNKKMMLLK